VEFFITWALILGLLVVPALVNYYVNRYFTPPGTSHVPTIELLGASLTLMFAFLVADMLIVLLISLGWDQLREQIADFVQMGLEGYARDRPIGLTGVLAVCSVAYLAFMALLGAFRVPSRFLR
jgi:hypothetical protein